MLPVYDPHEQHNAGQRRSLWWYSRLELTLNNLMARTALLLSSVKRW